MRRWCRDCQRWVSPKRSGFNTLAFLFLFVLGDLPIFILWAFPIIGPFLIVAWLMAYWWVGLIPAGLYLLYHFGKPKRCPICNGTNFGPFIEGGV